MKIEQRNTELELNYGQKHCPENSFWLPCSITALNVLVFERSDAEKSNLNEMFAVCSVLICLAARVRQAISG